TARLAAWGLALRWKALAHEMETERAHGGCRRLRFPLALEHLIEFFLPRFHFTGERGQVDERHASGFALEEQLLGLNRPADRHLIAQDLLGQRRVLQVFDGFD